MLLAARQGTRVLAVGVHDHQPVDLQLGVGDVETDMVLLPRVCCPARILGLVESHRVGEVETLQAVIGPGCAKVALDADGDVLLAAAKGFLLTLHQRHQRLLLDGLIVNLRRVQIVVEGAGGYVRQLRPGKGRHRL
jgi:hypothetical protein